MNQKEYKVLGVMSGTSLDGIDVALCHFEWNEGDLWKFQIKCAETIPYPSVWRQKLQEAIRLTPEEVTKLDREYTNYLAGVIAGFTHRQFVGSLDAICSHGHTLFHQPDIGYTLQLGNLPDLAQQLKQTIVCDFRVQDVAMGGQGAPLVPIGDRMLFHPYDFCLNLGGFANGSFELNQQRIAYDICPVNVVLNHYAEKLGKEFDEGGRFAASGTLDEALLQALNAIQFYEQSAPKSLGIEWVQKEIFPVLDRSGLPPVDILRSYTEHIACQLSLQFKPAQKIMVTGGGAYNQFLIDRMMQWTQNEIVIPTPQLIEFKEALVFAFLGVLKLRGEVNCLASVTGAPFDHSSGQIYTGNNAASD